jgi:hypothetical protein
VDFIATDSFAFFLSNICLLFRNSKLALFFDLSYFFAPRCLTERLFITDVMGFNVSVFVSFYKCSLWDSQAFLFVQIFCEVYILFFVSYTWPTVFFQFCHFCFFFLFVFVFGCLLNWNENKLEKEVWNEFELF